MSNNPRHFHQERREFIRVREECAVRYRFLGPEVNPGASLDGTTDNLSGGGLKLVGGLPNPDWIPDILLGRTMLAVEILMPAGGPPVQAVARAAWVEVVDRDSRRFLMGLRFREISAGDRERLIHFIIETQLP